MAITDTPNSPMGSRPFALQCEGRKAVTVNKKYPL